MNQNDLCELADEIMQTTCHNESETFLWHAVTQQIGYLEDLLQYPTDYRDCSAGVNGFIYYSETEKFAKDNLVHIVTVLTEFEEEIGMPIPKDTDNLFNWYAWFACEHIVGKIVMFMEDFPGDWQELFEDEKDAKPVPVETSVTVETESVDMSRFPHTCTICGEPAYIGMEKVECSKNCNR